MCSSTGSGVPSGCAQPVTPVMRPEVYAEAIQDARVAITSTPRCPTRIGEAATA